MSTSPHSLEILQAYERILKGSPAEGRYVEIGAGHKLHVIEVGMGPPLVILHGTGVAAYTNLPFLEHLEGVRAIAPDLPGSGLSDPIDIGGKGYRKYVVGTMAQILDALNVDQISLAGASGGGVWAIWYTLAHPERVQRLILLSGIPLLPGTRVPLPQRMAAMPIVGDIVARIPMNEQRIMSFMAMMGEKETVVRYPKLIQALAASFNDPVASKASRTEFSAFLAFLGWRNKMKIRANDLAQLRVSTLLIWGERDPLGGADVARSVSEAIPNSVLELLPAGHVPWLGYPEKVAQLIMDFVPSN